MIFNYFLSHIINIFKKYLTCYNNICIIYIENINFGVVFMEQSISSDLIRGHIDTIILYSLIDSDRYAQQISDTIEQKSESKYKINQATLYSSLKRLELLKHITSYWKDADNGRRKFFHLTEKGKQIVDDNLSNWSYSKNIIDKLMDIKNEPSSEPKILYVVKEQENSQSSTPSTTIIDEKIENKAENKPVELETKPDTTDTEKNDVNFRLILNPLIKQKEVKKEEKIVYTEPKILENDKIIDSQEEKYDFNQTVTNSDYNKDNLNYNGRLDFGDLRIKAAQEGYKIRVSSKDSASDRDKLLINKLNFISSLIMLLLLAIEFVPSCLLLSSFLNVSWTKIVLFFAIVFSPVLYFIIIYMFSPKKTTNKKPSGDVILTTAIIIFNLLLIIFATSLLAGLDLTIKTNLVKFIYPPFVILIDILLFLIIRIKLSKKKMVITK